jgi:mutator protein MutT
MAGADVGAAPGQYLEVVVGVLTDRAGRVLVNQRPAGKPRAGEWEFPGGKCEQGEVPRDALVRELREELGIEVRTAERFIVLVHTYAGADRPVRLDCWRVTHWSNAPRGLDGQELRWCEPAELDGLAMLEADRPLITALWLPSLLVYEPDPERLAQRLAARAARAAPGRVAWIGSRPFALPVGPAAGAGDVAGLVDAARQGEGIRVVRFAGLAVTGAAVSSLDEARAAALAGAGFLLLTTEAAPPELVESVGEIGLPYYLNRSIDPRRPPAPRERILPRPPPTGQLWWPVGA